MVRRLDDSSALESLRVLVVEDEPDTRELIKTVLGDHGAVVRDAASGQDGLAALDAFEPDIVVSDLSLPGGVDGWEMIRRLRDHPRVASVPAMALSANASHDDAARALAAGFDVHLAKPIGSSELVKAVLSIVDLRGRRREM